MGSFGTSFAIGRVMTYDTPNKSKREWEAEIFACLERVKQEVMQSTGRHREVALTRFHEVVNQLSALILNGTIPARHPCYSKASGKTS